MSYLLLLLVALVVNNHQACFASVSPRRSLFFIDSKTNSYLSKSGDAPTVDSSAQLSTLMAALMGAKTSASQDASKIEALVAPSPLKKARCHAVLSVAGMGPGDVQDLFNGNNQIREVQFSSDSSVQMQADAMATLAEANPSLSVIVLDQKGLERCAGNCIDEYLGKMSSIMGFTPSTSSLTFDDGTSLDLDANSGKLFAVEMATFFSGLQSQVTDQDVAEIALEGGSNDDVKLIEATLASLQGLSKESPEVIAAAKNAVKALLKASIQQLEDTFGGDITFQVNAFDAEEESKMSTVQELMGWKMEARRNLLANAGVSVPITKAPAVSFQAAAFPPVDQAAAKRVWTAKVAGLGGFLIILYFLLAGIWCLCFMPIKHDTLLFGAKKNE